MDAQTEGRIFFYAGMAFAALSYGANYFWPDSPMLSGAALSVAAVCGFFAVWFTLPERYRIKGWKMAPAILMVVCLLGFISSAGWMWWRYKHPWKPSPADYPSVGAMFIGGNPTGPFPLILFNDTKGPLINLSIGIRETGRLPFSNSGANIKMGDIEIGATPIPNWAITPGYYQVDMRYRGVTFLTEMLYVGFVGGTLREFSWRSDGQYQIDGQQTKWPFLGNYNFDHPVTGHEKPRVFELTSTMLATGIAANGLLIKAYSLMPKNTHDSVIGLQLNSMDMFIDGIRGDHYGPTQVEYVGSNLQKWYEFVPGNKIPLGAKQFAAEFVITGTAIGGKDQTVMHRRIEYDLDWQKILGGENGIVSRVIDK